jgi:hypothetical protein
MVGEEPTLTRVQESLICMTAHAQDLTLDDMRQLYEHYMPLTSRHPDALRLRDVRPWWHTHELGHLLTVPPVWIGKPGFGMDPYIENEPRWWPYDLAATHVSGRLLAACGRPDLFDGPTGECADVDWDALRDGDQARAQGILRRRGVLRLPRTRAGLEAKLRRVVAAARLRM